MFKLKYDLAISLAMMTAFISSSTFAEKIDLPLGDTEGTFHCVVNTLNPFVTVDIHTDGVTVKGFCSKQPYVKREGHVTAMPVTTFKDYYFEYKKDVQRTGSVTISPSTADALTCSEGKGDKKKSYGKGKYC